MTLPSKSEVGSVHLLTYVLLVLTPSPVAVVYRSVRPSKKKGSRRGFHPVVSNPVPTRRPSSPDKDEQSTRRSLTHPFKSNPFFLIFRVKLRVQLQDINLDHHCPGVYTYVSMSCAVFLSLKPRRNHGLSKPPKMSFLGNQDHFRVESSSSVKSVDNHSTGKREIVQMSCPNVFRQPRYIHDFVTYS